MTAASKYRDHLARMRDRVDVYRAIVGRAETTSPPINNQYTVPNYDDSLEARLPTGDFWF